MTYRPPQCTEREPDGSYEDCTWASGVMLQNAAHGDDVVPSTRKEYEALRVAGGDGPAENPGDGSNLGDLQAGFQNRYFWKPAYFLPSSQSDLWVRLPPGTGAVVQGSMGALDPYWCRWDEDFKGGHACYVGREDGQDRVWWMNPLAPPDYAGEWMPKQDLQSFWKGLEGARVMPITIGSRGEDMAVGYRFIASKVGIVEVVIDGAQMKTSSGRMVDIPRGQVRDCYALVELFDPIGQGSGAQADRKTSYALGKATGIEDKNVEAAYLLAYAGAFTATDAYNEGVEAASQAALEAKR